MQHFTSDTSRFQLFLYASEFFFRHALRFLGIDGLQGKGREECCYLCPCEYYWGSITFLADNLSNLLRDEFGLNIEEITH